MPLNPDFQFSANNLQDFKDCPRRFELKYVLKQSWPAEISQPVLEVEKKIELGSQFHTIANQYMCGIPKESITAEIQNNEMKTRFTNFIGFFSNLEKNDYFSEFRLIMPFQGYHLIAIFDVLCLTKDKKMMIIDWKTTTIPPKKEYFKEKIQTVLYPLLAYECRKSIYPLLEITAEDITMKYWFPVFPQNSIDFSSLADHLENDRVYIADMIKEIENTDEGNFFKTDNMKLCKFCQYRSLCERGISAGILDVKDASLDIEQMTGEISFESSEEITY